MKIDDLIEMYEIYKQKYCKESYKYISKLLTEAKIKHKQDWDKKPIKKGDHEQSWRAFKGKNMQKLILYMIKSEVNQLGLIGIDGDKIERSKNLSFELDKVKRNLAIDYGEFGLHLPDVDIIIYDPKSLKVICVISSKVTLRERLLKQVIGN